MKKLIIYKTPYDENIFKNKRKKIFKLIDTNIYYQNEEISLFEENIEYNEDLYELICFYLDLSLEEAKNLSQEPIDISNESFEKVCGMIHSTIWKYSYLSTNHSIFDFITELFIKILKNHYLINGNKRLAINFLKILCWRFGYYFKFSKVDNSNIALKKVQNYFWKIQEKNILHFTTILHNYDHKNDKEKNKIFGIIKDWIDNNTFIAINFKEKKGEPKYENKKKKF